MVELKDFFGVEGVNDTHEAAGTRPVTPRAPVAAGEWLGAVWGLSLHWGDLWRLGRGWGLVGGGMRG